MKRWGGESSFVQFYLGWALAQLGHYEEAEVEMMKAVALRTKESEETASEFDYLVLCGIESEFNEATVRLFITWIRCLNGDYSTALEVCRKVLNENPEDARGYWLRGWCLLQKQEGEAAAAAMEKALQLGAKSADVLNLYAMTLIFQGKAKEALPHIERALELAPEDAVILTNRGYCFIMLDRAAEAEAPLRKAVELNPDYATAWNNLGAWHDRQDNREMAMECFRKAAMLDPNDPMSQRNIALSLWNAGAIKEAIAGYERLNDPDEYLRLGVALVQKEMTEEAINAFQRAIDLKPALAVAHHDLGSLYLQEQRFAEALPCFQAAVDSAPEMATAHNQLGFLLSMDGEYEEAIKHCLKAIELEPEIPAYQNALLISLIGSGRITAAQLVHGDCGNLECGIESTRAMEQPLAGLFQKGGANAPEFRTGLRKLSRDVFKLGMIHGSRPNPQPEELLAVWKDHRDEVLKYLGTAEIRTITLLKESEDLSLTEEDQRKRAQDILDALTKKAEKFARLAEETEDSYKGEIRIEGYDRDWILGDPAFSIKKGEFTKEVLEDNKAFYLLQVVARHPGKAKHFEDKGVEESAEWVFKMRQRKDWEKRYLALLQNPAPDLVLAKVQNTVGERSLAEGELDDAKEHFEAALAIVKPLLGEENSLALRVKENLLQWENLQKAHEEPEAQGLVGLKPEDAKPVKEAQEEVDKLKKRVREHDDKLVVALVNLGYAYQKVAQFEKAVAKMEEAEKVARKVHHGEHVTVASCLHYLGLARQTQGNYKKAIEALEASRKMREKLKAKDSTLAESYNSLGLNYGHLGDFKKAAVHLNDALKIRTELWDDTHESVVATLNNLALNLDRQGAFKNAKEMYLRALKGKRTPTVLSNLGVTLGNLAEYPEARTILEEAIELFEGQKEGASTGLAMAYNNLGGVLIEEGQKPKAKERFQQALELHGETHGLNHPDRVMILNNLGAVLSGPKAEKTLEEAIHLGKACLAPDHPTVVACLNSLAHALMSNDNVEEAEKRSVESVAMARRLFEKEAHPMRAATLTTLAQIQSTLKRPDAEQTAKDAVAMARKVYQQPHPSLAECLFVHAKILFNAGSFAEARAPLSEALKMREGLFGDKDRRVEKNRGELGVLLTILGEHAAGAKHLREALEFYNPHYGADSAETASLLVPLATALTELNELPEAEAKFDQAIDVLSNKAGHRDSLADALLHRSTLAIKEDNPAEAEKWLLDSLEVMPQLEKPNLDLEFSARSKLASALREQGKLDQAEGELKKAHAKVIAAGLQNSGTRKNILEQLARILIEQENWPEAEEVLKEVVKLRRAVEAPLAGSLLRLGAILAERARHAEAEEVFREAWQLLREKVQDKDNLGVAAVLTNLGRALDAQGKYAQAEARGQEALDMMTRLKGASDPQSLACLNNLAMVFESQERHQDAEKAYRQIVKSLEAQGKKGTIDESSVLNNLGRTLWAQKRFDDAEKTLHRALKIQRDEDGKEHPASMTGLARILRDQGQFEKADELYSRTITAMEAKYAGDPRLARVLGGAAKSLAKQKDFAGAQAQAERAYQIQEKALPPTSPEWEDTFDLLGEIHTGLEKTEEAAKFAKLAEELRAGLKKLKEASEEVKP